MQPKTLVVPIGTQFWSCREPCPQGATETPRREDEAAVLAPFDDEGEAASFGDALAPAPFEQSSPSARDYPTVRRFRCPVDVVA